MAITLDRMIALIQNAKAVCDAYNAQQTALRQLVSDLKDVPELLPNAILLCLSQHPLPSCRIIDKEDLYFASNEKRLRRHKAKQTAKRQGMSSIQFEHLTAEQAQQAEPVEVVSTPRPVVALHDNLQLTELQILADKPELMLIPDLHQRALAVLGTKPAELLDRNKPNPQAMQWEINYNRLMDMWLDVNPF